MDISETKPANKAPLISLAEWRFVAIAITVILLITSLPYLYAQVSTPRDKVFMGVMLDVPDHLQYFSWMRELTYTNLASNKLTPEPNQPVFFNLLWWSLGRIGNIVGLGYAGMFQILRVFSTMIFLFLAYRLCALFFIERKYRVVSFLVICFTSGLGWILILLKYTVTHGVLLLPLDVFIAEGNTFLSILGYPHFIAALWYILVLELVLVGEQKNRFIFAVLAGIFALFLGWQHAYDLISVYAILASYGLLKWLRDKRLPVYLLKSGFLVVLISCWPAIYSVMLTTLDPIWKDVLAQFDNAGVFTPDLIQLPILLGFPFLVALFTAIIDKPFVLKEKSDVDLFFLGWFSIGFVLVYLPVDYQIHLLNGWQIPISILATKGWFTYVMPFIKRSSGKLQKHVGYEKLGIALLFILILPTNIYLFAWRFFDLARHDYPFYLNKDETSALQWLDTAAKPEDVILSSLTIGQFIPAYTGSYAYLAHWAQTIDFFTKQKNVEAFFSENTGDDLRQAILHEKGVDYIFWGPAEQSLGQFNPKDVPYLEKVFTSSKVLIFKVNIN